MRLSHFAALKVIAMSLMICGLGLTGEVRAFSHVTTLKSRARTLHQPLSTLFSTEEDGGSMEPESPAPESASPPVPTPPPPVPPKRLDPLMASLTRMDPTTANSPTKTVPLFGEVPVDGGLTVLIPAAVIAFLGFVFSIVVAINSQDELVRTLSQVSEDIAQQASEQTNRVYDPNECRGICASTEQDFLGRGFMESLRK